MVSLRVLRCFGRRRHALFDETLRQFGWLGCDFLFLFPGFRELFLFLLECLKGCSLFEYEYG
jgi:hypothetical protein